MESPAHCPRRLPQCQRPQVHEASFSPSKMETHASDFRQTRCSSLKHPSPWCSRDQQASRPASSPFHDPDLWMRPCLLELVNIECTEIVAYVLTKMEEELTSATAISPPHRSYTGAELFPHHLQIRMRLWQISAGALGKYVDEDAEAAELDPAGLQKWRRSPRL
ncbi:hypothetical protein MLD38_029175 [Melastoma candidum]|uniref:Uncharacterized protein n=1 Tax=Melastoma candidum TaxID=119954 RepID=A0ACB9N5G6_9MYRT|nr:hypothetical protein MLD38_029175 [Melastoma candidum]